MISEQFDQSWLLSTNQFVDPDDFMRICKVYHHLTLVPLKLNAPWFTIPNSSGSSNPSLKFIVYIFFVSLQIKHRKLRFPAHIQSFWVRYFSSFQHWNECCVCTDCCVHVKLFSNETIKEQVIPHKQFHLLEFQSVQWKFWNEWRNFIKVCHHI